MALSLQTNYSSLVTQTTLSKTNTALTTSQQRLATGFRINSAADDAAGMQIATRLNAGSRGMAVAMRNTSDASSLMQTAEGSLNEVTDILQKMKDLAGQSANGTNTQADRDAMQAEYDEMGKELYNIMENSSYGGTKMFGADGASGLLGTGPVDFQIGSTSAEKLTVDVSTNSGALATALQGLSASYSAAGTAGTEISTGAGANTQIDALAGALDKVGALRGQLGANMNRMSHISNNLANMKDNTDVAKGRITDTDYAAESAASTKNSMLMQSGISMLKQAGQMPNMIMSLLG